MKISRVYSNRPDVFTPISFHHLDDDPKLNVIYGDVRRPDDHTKDSHNLGKTTLLHLIEFLMLKGTSTEQFLVKHQARFSDFVFFIEVALNSGEYATVRRAPSNPNSIALVKHAESEADYSRSPEDSWDHIDLSLADARTLLDGWLDLRILQPYDYRKAITYFLRAQGDYEHELQLQKFRSGRDLYWKPFISHLFGFDETLAIRKYELDDEVTKLNEEFESLQAEIQYAEDDLPELHARITTLRQTIEEVEARLDAFSFDAEESEIMTEVVERIEREIADTNEALYDVRFDIRQIRAARGHKDKFDLKTVASVFEEAEIAFPGQLKRGYEELIQFNKQVTAERDRALGKRLKELEQQEEKLSDTKSLLDAQRSQHLKVIRSTDTFEKFKELQKT